MIGSNFQGDSNDQKTIRAEKNGTQDRFLSLHCRTSICISHPSHLTIIHTKAWLGGRGMIYQAIIVLDKNEMDDPDTKSICYHTLITTDIFAKFLPVTRNLFLLSNPRILYCHSMYWRDCGDWSSLLSRG